jgi:hypothetical protein
MSSIAAKDEQPHIVRCRISQKMAFPVGYELLREHFGATSWWPDAGFYFHDNSSVFASEFAQILKTRQSYRIFQIERRPDNVMHLLKKRYSFTICPVVRELRSIAKEALTPLFPALRQFIDGIPVSSVDRRSISAMFTPSDGTCRVE